MPGSSIYNTRSKLPVKRPVDKRLFNQALLSILLTVALTLTEDSLVCSRAVLTEEILHSLDLFGGVRLRPVVSIIGTNFRDWCRRILDTLTKDTLDGEEFYLHGAVAVSVE